MESDHILQSKPIIGLYADWGVALNSLWQLKRILSPYYVMVTLKAGDIIKKNWPPQMRIFIMPGGADVPYYRKLRGQGCARIRAFVESGGIYVGICAGSYFAATNIYFTCANGRVIKETRELKLFTGCIWGPVFGPYLNKGHTSAKLVPVMVAGQAYQAYFNGGGVLEGGARSDIIGLYQETNQPMALQCKVGLGQAILCAVHPEYDATFLRNLAARNNLSRLTPVAADFDKGIKAWFLSTLRQMI